MNRRWISAPLALLALSGCGEKPAAPQIEVMGQAVVEKDAEIFRIAAEIRERDKDRLKSLGTASKKLEELKDRLARLKGLTHLKITSTEAVTETVRPRGCDTRRSYDDAEYPENCKPLDFLTSIDVSVEGEPAGTAGTAASLLTELGLEKVNLRGYAVKDPDAANLEVRQKALADATNTARALAGQAGMRLGAPFDIGYGAERYVGRREYEYPMVRAAPEIAQSGALLTSPSVALELPPEKVTFAASVHVKFAIEDSKAGR